MSTSASHRGARPSTAGSPHPQRVEEPDETPEEYDARMIAKHGREYWEAVRRDVEREKQGG